MVTATLEERERAKQRLTNALWGQYRNRRLTDEVRHPEEPSFFDRLAARPGEMLDDLGEGRAPTPFQVPFNVGRNAASWAETSIEDLLGGKMPKPPVSSILGPEVEKTAQLASQYAPGGSLSDYWFGTGEGYRPFAENLREGRVGEAAGQFMGAAGDAATALSPMAAILLGAMENPAMRTQVEQANAMKAAGQSPSKTWQQTGIDFDIDAKPVYELPETDAKIFGMTQDQIWQKDPKTGYSPSMTTVHQWLKHRGIDLEDVPMYLSEVYQIPKLYESEPRFKNTRIFVGDPGPGANAATYVMESGNPAIIIRPETELGQLKPLLSHELQHVGQIIQQRPGGAAPSWFAEGGSHVSMNPDDANPYDFYHRVSGEVEARNTSGRASEATEDLARVRPTLTEDVRRREQIILDPPKYDPIYSRMTENEIQNLLGRQREAEGLLPAIRGEDGSVYKGGYNSSHEGLKMDHPGQKFEDGFFQPDGSFLTREEVDARMAGPGYKAQVPGKAYTEDIRRMRTADLRGALKRGDLPSFNDLMLSLREDPGLKVDMVGLRTGDPGAIARVNKALVSLGAHPTTSAKTIVNKTKEQGGYSVNIATGEIPKSGIMVGKYKNTDPRNRVIEGEPTPKDVEAQFAKNQKEYQNPDTFFGTWGDDGKTYFDVVRRFNENEVRQATKFGERTGQLAIWNIGEGRAMPVGKWEEFIKSPEYHQRLDFLASLGRKAIEGNPDATVKEWWDTPILDELYGPHANVARAFMGSTSTNATPKQNVRQMSEYMRRFIKGEAIIQPNFRIPETAVFHNPGGKMPLEQARRPNLERSARGEAPQGPSVGAKYKVMTENNPDDWVPDRRWMQLSEDHEKGVYSSGQVEPSADPASVKAIGEQLAIAAKRNGRSIRDFSADIWTGWGMKDSGANRPAGVQGMVQSGTWPYNDLIVRSIKDKAAKMGISVDEFKARLSRGDAELLSALLATPALAAVASQVLGSDDGT